MTCKFYYENRVWTLNLATLYSCEAKVGSSGTFDRIDGKIIGNHLSGRTKEHVQCVIIKNQNLNFFPKGVGASFPNLVDIWVENSGLMAINREDLADMPNLKQIELSRNKIQSLNSDVFASNPQIQAISLYKNPVRRVGYSLFNKLTLLTTLNTGAWNCIDKPYANKNKAEVQDLILAIAVYCPPTSEMIIADIVNSERFNILVAVKAAESVCNAA